MEDNIKKYLIAVLLIPVLEDQELTLFPATYWFLSVPLVNA